MIAALESVLQSLLLLAIRLYWGAAFFMAGWKKLHDISAISDYFASLHIPYPILNAYLVGGIECVGGLCLFFGLASRLVSIPLIVIMITALFTAHYDPQVSLFDYPQHLVAQPPFNFLLTALIVLAFGPGKVSLDFLLHRDKK